MEISSIDSASELFYEFEEKEMPGADSEVACGDSSHLKEIFAFEESCAKARVTELLIEAYTNNFLGWPALHYAVAQKDIATAREILRRDPSQIALQVPFSDGVMAKRHATFTYKEILEKTALFSSDLLCGPSVLFLAVQSGSLDFVRELLELGLDVDDSFVETYGADYKGDVGAYYGLGRDFQFDMNGRHFVKYSVCARVRTLLGEAVAQQNVKMVQLLASYGASTENVLHEVNVEWLYAYQGNRESISRYTDLVKKSAYDLAGDEVLSTLLGGKSEVVQACKAHINFELPPLFHAIVENDYEAFDLLLQNGFDPNLPFSSKTALDFALESPNSLFLNRLGVNSEPVGRMTGWPALHEAIAKKQFDVALEILRTTPEQVHLYAPFFDRKIEVDYEDGYTITSFQELLEPMRGHSALILAVMSGSVELVKAILEAGVDVNGGCFLPVASSTIEGSKISFVVDYKTALGEAIALHNCEMVELLLSHGADASVATMRTTVTAEYCKGELIGHRRIGGQMPGGGVGRVFGIYKWDWYTQADCQSQSALKLGSRNGEIIAAILRHQNITASLALINAYTSYGGICEAIVAGDLSAFQAILQFEGGKDKRAVDYALENSNPAFFESLYPFLSQDLSPKLRVAIEQKNERAVRSLLAVGVEIPNLLLAAVEADSVEICALVLAYKKPSREELEKAQELALKKPAPNRKILQLIIQR